MNSEDAKMQEILEGMQSDDNDSEGEKNSNVLVTNTSSLVEIIFLDENKLMVTVDSNSLLRIWNLSSGEAMSSYNVNVDGRVTAAAVDKTFSAIAIGNDKGLVKIFNIHSGGILYTLPVAPSEVTALSFADGISDYWLLGTCWDGKMMMWSAPDQSNDFSINARCKVGHRNDIISLDCNQRYIATGGADGLVTLWNMFSGVPIPSTENVMKSKNVVGVKLLKKSPNILFVLHEAGDVHCIDASNGNFIACFIAMAGINSNWDYDKEEEVMLVVGDEGNAILYEI